MIYYNLDLTQASREHFSGAGKSFDSQKLDITALEPSVQAKISFEKAYFRKALNGTCQGMCHHDAGLIG